MHGIGNGEPVAKSARLAGMTSPKSGLNGFASTTSFPATTVATDLRQDPSVHLAERWRQTMNKVVRSVVSVHFSSVCPFDTEQAYVSEATGFIVDAERGIIMTNRHVVGPGPFRGYAVFDNHEECPVQALFRDPVHDFGFLKFNPSHVKHMPIQELSLRPEKAHVGAEIRVVGNDAGEKLTILNGFVSRVDRNAPEYGELTYNDFNTEYIQAAASASGGSSGSPVVDIDGDVLALQAGGSSVASTDFFLPLFRGSRALKLLQQGLPVTRGTIQVQWLLKPYDECSRLGLSAEDENKARESHPEAIGLLVAETVLPTGPANGLVQEGDCLLAVNDTPVCRFRDVDDFFDSSLGSDIKLTLARRGKTDIVNLKVQDLYSITPSRFVRFAGGIYHDTSYQIARYYAIPVRGVYVANIGIYFTPPTNVRERCGWIVDELDHRPTPDLDTFIEVVRGLHEGSRVVAQCRHVDEPHNVVPVVITVPRNAPTDGDILEMATRNNKTGLWDFESLGSLQPPREPQQHKAQFNLLNAGSQPISELVRSFVQVRSTVPVAMAGSMAADYTQHGFVVDADRGLVIVSRVGIPHFNVDVSVEVAESVLVDAKVVFLHPQHNYAIVQFNRALVNAPIQSMDMEPQRRLSQGDSVVFVGYDSLSRPLMSSTTVSDVTPTEIPSGPDVPPRYRATNIETVQVDSETIPDRSNAGVLADADTGRVRAIWMVFVAGVNPTTYRDRWMRLALDTVELASVLAQLQLSTEPDPRFVDVEVRTISVSSARMRNVPERWLEGRTNYLVEVARVSHSLRDILHEGDVCLAMDGSPLERVSQLLNLGPERSAIDMTIVRRGQEEVVVTPTTRASETVVPEIVSWCGMLVHRPHHAVMQQLKQPPAGVYIASIQLGSPANMYNIWQTSFVTHVNGEETPDVDTFHRIASTVPDDTYVKIRAVTYEGVPQARSIRTNYHYFPTWRKTLGEDKVYR